MTAGPPHRPTLPLILFLAWHNLSENPLSFALLLAAVAAGVGFQIPNTANQSGYEAELLKEGILTWNGDVRVRPREHTRFEESEELVTRLRLYPGVRAALPVLMVPGAIKARGPLTGALVVGVHTGGELHPFRLISGTPLTAGDAHGALLGVSLAERVGARVGDQVSLRILLSTGPQLFEEDRLGRYTVVIRGMVGGTFGAQESIFLDRRFLAQEMGTPYGASMILMYLGDHHAARGLARQIEVDLPRVQARAWIEDSAYLASSIRASHAVGAVTQAMVILAVAIPVLALLYVHVLNRRRDIGLLCALGFGPREIFAVFLTQALLVGLIGAGFGCALGMALIRYFQLHPIFEWEGFVIRPVLAWKSFAQPVLTVLGATVLAGVYPALRASLTEPAPVLRGVA